MINTNYFYSHFCAVHIPSTHPCKVNNILIILSFLSRVLPARFPQKLPRFCSKSTSLLP